MTAVQTARRTILAIGMVAAPILVAVSIYISPATGDTTDAYYEAVAAHRVQFIVANSCLAWGLFLFVCAAVAINLVTPGRGSTWALVGGSLLAVGALGAGGNYWGGTLIQSSLSPEVDRTVTDLIEANGPGLLYALPRLLIIAGCVVAGVGLLRATTVPRWAAILVLVGGVLCAFIGTFGKPSQLLTLPLAVGLLGVAIELVRGPGAAVSPARGNQQAAPEPNAHAA